MALASDEPSLSSGPSSFYSTIKLAHVVQRVKERFMSIKKSISSSPATPAKTPHVTRLKSYTRERVSNVVKSRARSGSYLGSFRSTVSNHLQAADTTSLLHQLDSHASKGNPSLTTIARQDSLFLRHDSLVTGITDNAAKLHDVLDLTTLLLTRLQIFLGTDDPQQGCGGSVLLTSDELKCNKSLANLEHMIRCLRQSTLEAIICQYLHLVEAHILHWHKYWQYRRHLDEGWFAEWPNGERPLSTTWPWNIKPSLLVLWGVCWMFYGPSGHNTNTSRWTRNRRGAAPSRGEFRTGQQVSQHDNASFLPTQPSRQQYDEPIPTTSEAWAGPASTSIPNFSWLHPTQAGVTRRRASESRDSQFSRSHGIGPYDSTVTQGIPVPALQAIPTSVAVNPYITGTSNVSSDLFPAAQIAWPYSQGINPDPASASAYISDFSSWQQPTSISYNTNFSSTSQRTRSGTGLQSYGPEHQVAIPQAAGGSIGSLGFGLGLQDMQSYPSPHSDVSHQTTSPTMSVLPGGRAMTSPNVPFVASPSVAGSSLSGRSSRKSLEPPRTMEGNIYCDHQDCSAKPPVFSRKCEWTKHMDRHTRPYLCDEPGCENIRGFTYSGGLLRHQREVHRQHGGPKASCFCPHKDCKRSTGVGFSRRENLNEHLRRVHRETTPDEEPEPEQLPELGGTRKRRRAAQDESERDEDENLQQEVRKLRRELQEKDERLKRLEQLVEKLAKGQHK